MRPSTVLDRSVLAADPPVARELLVFWQHSETHEMVPAGRFSHDGETYCFACGGHDTELPTLPGLDDLRRRFVTHRLPAVFRQRIMDSDRPDYGTTSARSGSIRRTRRRGSRSFTPVAREQANTL